MLEDELPRSATGGRRENALVQPHRSNDRGESCAPAHEIHAAFGQRGIGRPHGSRPSGTLQRVEVTRAVAEVRIDSWVDEDPSRCLELAHHGERTFAITRGSNNTRGRVAPTGPDTPQSLLI